MKRAIEQRLRRARDGFMRRALTPTPNGLRPHFDMALAPVPRLAHAQWDFGDVTFNTAPLSVAYFSEPDVGDGMTGIVHVSPEPLPPVVPERVTVYRGAVDVDLRDLTDLGLLITAAEIPAGEYTKVVLSITNPRLTLVSDPGTVIENV